MHARRRIAKDLYSPITILSPKGRRSKYEIMGFVKRQYLFSGDSKSWSSLRVRFES